MISVQAEGVTAGLGTVRVTLNKAPRHGSMPESRIVRMDLDVTSDGDGAAGVTVPVAGKILRLVTNPGATAPTANWDYTCVDQDGLDVIGGLGANRHTSNSEGVLPLNTATPDATEHALPVVVCGELTFAFTNMGAAKQAKVSMYLEV